MYFQELLHHKASETEVKRCCLLHISAPHRFFFGGSLTSGSHNLKHMRISDLLSVGVLRFPRVCMFSDLRTHPRVCVPIHRCTEEEGGANTHTHIVLITGPISNGTSSSHRPSASSENNLPTLQQQHTETLLRPRAAEAGKRCYGGSQRWKQQGGLLGLGSEAVLSPRGQPQVTASLSNR